MLVITKANYIGGPLARKTRGFIARKRIKNHLPKVIITTNNVVTNSENNKEGRKSV